MLGGDVRHMFMRRFNQGGIFSRIAMILVSVCLAVSHGSLDPGLARREQGSWRKRGAAGRADIFV